MKACSKCAQHLPLTAFYKDKTRLDGLAYWCKTCQRIKNQKFAADRPGYFTLVNAEYRRKNANAVKIKSAAYTRANRGAHNARKAKRRAAELLATPPWLTTEHWRQMQEFYRRAQLESSPTQVDHIVPLQGKNVCGLHVPWNLQLLPAKANASKGNRCSA